jgi:hypothetical protein
MRGLSAKPAASSNDCVSCLSAGGALPSDPSPAELNPVQAGCSFDIVPLGIHAPTPLPTTMWNLLKEFLQYLVREKKWWLIPLVVILILIGAVLIFASASGLGWAIYPFM